jgi:hypothetical protein
VITALGATVAPMAESLDDLSNSAPAALGGISCLWTENKNYGTYFQTIVLSASAGEKVSKAGIHCYGADISKPAQQGSCAFDAVRSGYWISGVVYTPAGTTNSKAKASVRSLVSSFEATAASLPAPAARVAVAGAWKKNDDCEAVSAAARVPAVLGNAALTAQDADTSGGERPHGLYAAIGTEGIYACYWGDGGASSSAKVTTFSAMFLPGGASEAQAIAAAPGAKTVTIAGAEHAYASVHYGTRYINAFTATNWLQIEVTPTTKIKTLSPAITALIAALDKRAPTAAQ